MLHQYECLDVGINYSVHTTSPFLQAVRWFGGRIGVPVRVQVQIRSGGM